MTKKLISKLKKKPRRNIREKVGKPPGTLVYTGEKESEKINIFFTEYNEGVYKKEEAANFEELQKKLEKSDPHTVKWINVIGIHDPELISKIGKLFDIHPLTLEDILNTEQRPKIDVYDNYLYTVMKNMRLEKNHHASIETEHVSLIISEKTVLSFQDSKQDIFPEVYNRIENGTGVFRKSFTDYLYYVLIDYVIDNYFLVTEELNGRIDELQDSLMFNPEEEDLPRIQALKKEIQHMRQRVAPLREILNELLRGESRLITSNSIVYLKDTLDHLLHINETMDSFRDSVTSLVDAYLTSLSAKMNEVMQVLTIIATIFIPLTFIAGVYGMNFAWMPELEWKYGYPAVMLFMFLISVGLIFYFKKKKWF